MEGRKLVPICPLIHNEYAKVEGPIHHRSQDRPRCGLANPVIRSEDRKYLERTRPVQPNEHTQGKSGYEWQARDVVTPLTCEGAAGVGEAGVEKGCTKIPEGQ